jgi:hypothetical protein
MNTLDIGELPSSHDEGDSEPRAALRDRAKGLALAIALVSIFVGCTTALFVTAGPNVAVNKPQDCIAIPDSDSRLSCYDASVHRAAPQPARGAMAPSTTPF